MDKVTVAGEFFNEAEARIAAGMLGVNGIYSQVLVSNIGTLYGSGPIWAPVRIVVDESNLAEARRLLHEHGDI